MKKLITFLFLGYVIVSGTLSQPFPYQNADLSAEDRADDIISRMTLDEKISQMIDVASPITHLNIPAYNWWNEGLHGVARAGYATVFPQAIGLAAMWNDSLQYKIAKAISDEFRAKYNDAIMKGNHERYYGLTVWSPNINIFRDPRWGRGQETYGEDPFLTSRLGVAFVKGLQGEDPKYFKTIATPKHFVVHSGPEKSRHTFNANVSNRDFYETYTLAFEACIKEGKAYSLMGAYNRFRGKSCSANDSLLNIILRDEWGFQGYVVSDCDAIGDIFSTHKIVPTAEEASALGIKNGCDLDCGNTYKSLKTAVERGLITEKEIDKSLKRLMIARIRLGMFDPESMVAYAQIPFSKNDCDENRKLALTAAQQSLVLLKNNGALPLNRRILNKIAIVGPNSDDAAVMYGNYNGMPSKAVTPLQGIKNALLPKTKVISYTLNSLVPELPLTSIISSSNLETDGKPGLKAEYFSNKSFEGTPISRIDTSLNFDWSASGPVSSMSNKNFSVRWTGKISAPETGEYAIAFTADDGFRVYIDGKILLESWLDQSFTTKTQKIKLNNGEKHDLKIEYYQGEGGAGAKLHWAFSGTKSLDKIIDEIAQCDVIIYVGGLSPSLEGEEMNVSYAGFDGGDRTSIDLPKIQLDMLKKLKKTGKPVIFVVMTGSALALNWENDNLDAILLSWYPGEEGGTAIASVLFGDYNPGGRLPVTFYKSLEQLPAFDNYNMVGRTYRYFKGEPLYPFGYGLCYTKFTYSNLIVPSTSPTTQTIKVKVTVLNSGTKEGDEVVQLYVRHPTATVPVPIHSLKGFKRIHLKAGERRTIDFDLSLRDIAVLDNNSKWVITPGDIDILVGGIQPAEKLINEGKILMGTVTKTGENNILN